MYISALTIQDVRCYTSIALEFSAGVNLLIGENNSGKSTVLDAILMLQNQRLGTESIRYAMREAHVAVTLSQLDPSRLGRMKLFRSVAQEKNRTQAAKIEFRILPGSFVMKAVLLPPGGGEAPFELFPAAQPNNFLIPYLSSRRATGLPDSVGSQFALDMTGTLNHLQAKIDRCYTSRQLRPKYEAACQAVLGTVITTYPVPNGKAAGLEIDPLASGGHIRIAQMGSGVAQALGLIVELLTATEQVFVIEELETDLHPRALRSLMRLIEDSVGNGCQFFISSHSNIVLRHLGSLERSKVFRVSPMIVETVPRSHIDEVPNDPTARRALLSELGYELTDYELYDAWLLLEESSAERVIREFIVPLFAPALVGRVRTVAASGASDLEPRFDAFNRLFAFLHLEAAFAMKAWVIADGDEIGRESIEKLRTRFTTWPPANFMTWSQQAFEHYYPRRFADRVNSALKQAKPLRQEAKKKLLEEVLLFLREDVARARTELRESAGEVIETILGIEAAVHSRRRSQT